MAVTVGSFVKSTSTGLQVVTGIPMTSRALLVWTAGATALDTYQTGVLFSLGVTDGVTSACLATGYNYNTASTQAYRRHATNLITIIDGGGTILAAGTLSAFTTTGFVIDWTINNDQPYIIIFEAFGGADLGQVKLLPFQTSTTLARQPVTGVGFTSSQILLFGAYSTVLDTNVADATMLFGCPRLPGSEGSNAQGWSIGWHQRNNALYSLGYTTLTNVDHVIHSATPPAAFQGDLYSLDNDGFTLDWTLAQPLAACYFHALCFEGGSYAVSFTAGLPVISPRKTVAVAPATQVFTTPTEPEAVLMAMGHDMGGQYGLCFSLGASDGVNERCAHINDRYAADPTRCWRYQTNKLIAQDYSEATNYPTQITDAAATVQSLDTNGFTVVWEPNNGMASNLGWFTVNLGAAIIPGHVYVYGVQEV